MTLKNKLIIASLILGVQTLTAQPLFFCDAAKGLELLGQDTFSSAQIEMILKACDQSSPNDFAVLLLHGLYARKEAELSKQYTAAIYWLEKASNAALPHDFTAQLELANTYELANDLPKALAIYQSILTQKPENRSALLGEAHVLKLQSQYAQALTLYQHLLNKNPNDVDALNGVGWIKTGENNLKAATEYFNAALKIEPANEEALLALSKINATQKQLMLDASSWCQAMQGIILLNAKNPPLAKIEAILNHCDKNSANASDTQLLHGLLERFKGQPHKNYSQAISWLQKASKTANASDLTPELELAVTYEWASEPAKAAAIYQKILVHDPNNRAALLGQARVWRTQNQINKASDIYQALLKKNPKDVEGLNGSGWIEIAKKNMPLAVHFFQETLKIQPKNEEALVGLEKTKIKPPVKIISLCDADEALILLNKKNPPLGKINAILSRCDHNTPNDASTLLLHGLLARYDAAETNDYQLAVIWLEKAIQAAAPGNDGPYLELALTFEKMGEPKKSLFMYQTLLAQKPHNEAVTLGVARSLSSLYRVPESLSVYHQLLKNNPRNIDALNGLGLTLMGNYEFKKSREVLNEALHLSPDNAETVAALKVLDTATKYTASLTGGNYSVPPEVSNGLNLYFLDNLNATDALIVYATHNTKQIGESFFSGPTLLPNNSVLLGYQHKLPKQHGWGLSYDYRQHNHLPDEHRVFGTSNLYLTRNLEWFHGVRIGFASPWNNQLVFSGLTMYTNLPVNVSFTGFWANQEVGGQSHSFSLDFSKEFKRHLFYNIGPSYSPTLKNWEVHGKITIPTFTNQAFIADYSHFFFNNSTFVNVGWQLYWA